MQMKCPKCDWMMRLKEDDWTCGECGAVILKAELLIGGNDNKVQILYNKNKGQRFLAKVEALENRLQVILSADTAKCKGAIGGLELHSINLVPTGTGCGRLLEKIEYRTHKLKVWPEYFGAIKKGEKTFEVRKNDRDFRVGETLILAEWCPKKERYTGEEITRKITYIISGDRWGIKDGVCVLALSVEGELKKLRAFKLYCERHWEGCGYEKQHWIKEEYENIFGVKPEHKDDLGV